MGDYGPSIHLEGLSREKHAELAAQQAQAKNQPRTIPAYPLAETRSKQGPAPPKYLVRGDEVIQILGEDVKSTGDVKSVPVPGSGTGAPPIRMNYPPSEHKGGRVDSSYCTKGLPITDLALGPRPIRPDAGIGGKGGIGGRGGPVNGPVGGPMYGRPPRGISPSATNHPSGLNGQPRPAVNAFGNPIVPPGTIRPQQMPFIPPPQSSSSSSSHQAKGSSTGRMPSTTHGPGTGREIPPEQRSVGSHHLPSYLPASPFATTGDTRGILSNPKHQPHMAGDLSSSSSYPIPQSANTSGKSSSTGRDQTQPYTQDYTARSSIDETESTILGQANADTPVVGYTYNEEGEVVWSQCWDDEAGAVYYFNNVTGEASWLPPEET